MQIVEVENQNEAAEKLSTTLKSALEKFPAVTWFIPGGSNIAIAASAMAQIPEELTTKLILAQTDERYGPVGHKDSNWQQLLDAGFELKQAKALPILHEPELPLGGTAELAAKITGELIKSTYTIGQFGIGPDSHIAGIKPDSPASVASGLATGYEWSDFTRITLTFSAIRQLNQILAFTFGESKKAMLESLVNEHHQPMTQPAQILKSVANAVVYNDQIDS